MVFDMGILIKNLNELEIKDDYDRSYDKCKDIKGEGFIEKVMSFTKK